MSNSLPTLQNQKFTILIRNTYRPTLFKRCIQSVLHQRYPNYEVIMCYDDDRCLEYLEKYMKTEDYPNVTVFKVQPPDKTKSHFYNLYMNELLDRVKDGWILALDDDDVFLTPLALKKISLRIKTTEDVLFWKFKLGDQLIYPLNFQDIRVGRVDTAGFCFHSKYKHVSRWIARRCGDFHFLRHLLDNTKSHFRCVNMILTSAQMGRGLKGKKEVHVKNMKKTFK